MSFIGFGKFHVKEDIYNCYLYSYFDCINLVGIVRVERGAVICQNLTTKRKYD